MEITKRFSSSKQWIIFIQNNWGFLLEKEEKEIFGDPKIFDEIESYEKFTEIIDVFPEIDESNPFNTTSFLSEVPEENSEPYDDKPEENPEEGSVNPNDDTPDEDQEEGSFNPNEDITDEDKDDDLFNPNEDKPDEETDEELFNPNEDVPDEEPDEELFDPNEDVPDEEPDEELFDPNEDDPDEVPDGTFGEYKPDGDISNPPEEMNNPSSSGTLTIAVPEQPEQVPDQEPEQEPIEEPDPEVVPEWVPPEELAGNEIPEIEVPDDTFEPIEPEQEPIEEPDPDVAPEWAPPEELAGNNIPEIEVPEETFEPIQPEQEPDPEIVSEWIPPEELAGENIPEMDVPEGIFEPLEAPEQETINAPEQELDPDPEIVPEWAPPEELAGNNIPEIEVPEGMFEPIEESEEQPDLEVIPEWIPLEELAGDNIPEIDVPEGIFEPIEPEKELINVPEQESDPEVIPEWVPQKELAGEFIPEIDVPEGILEPLEEPEQDPIKDPEYESEQDKNNENIQESSSEAYSDTIQQENRTLVMVDNYSSGYNDTNSYKGTTPIEKRSDQRKYDKHLPRKTKKPQDQRKDSGSDYKSINKQRSRQSTVLVQKPEFKNQEKEKETEKETEKKQLKKENEDKAIQASTNREQKDVPKIEKKDEQEIPNELKEEYRQETGKRPIYKGKKTKGFDEWLKKRANPEQQKQQKKQESEEDKELKEDWEKLLEKWINEANENEIPVEVKKQIIKQIKKFRELRDIERKLVQLIAKKSESEKESNEIEKLINDWNEMHDALFENLRAFRNFYNKNINWFEYRIKAKREKFIKFLVQKLRNQDRIEQSPKEIKKNWMEILKENLYKNTTLSPNEKTLIIKILQKGELTKGDKKELIFKLRILPTNELISLLGKDFEVHTQNYVRWGWDYDQGVKRLILKRYLTRKIYRKPEEKIKIQDSGFKLISEKLKHFTYKEISEKIDHNFKALINRRHKISISVFNKLKRLMKVNDIPHDIYIGNKKKIFLDMNDDIAELIGVMLGDGNLGSDGSKVAISLNRVDDENYVLYIENKLKTLFYDKQPLDSRNWFKLQNNSSKGVEITCYSKNLHYFLVEKGLIPGKKAQNQISIPESILKKNIFKKKCLKGLFDTDGSINVQMKSGALRLIFVNASKALVENFKKICNDLSMSTGKILTSYIERNKTKLVFYSVQITGKKHVLKFLEMVDPEKMKEPNRRIYLSTRLILANAPKFIINLAKKKIQKWNLLNGQKYLIYTKKNTIFLRGLCEKLFTKKGIKEIYSIKFNGKLTNEMLERAIKIALSYAPNQLGLKKTTKEVFSFPLVLRNKICQFLFRILIKSTTPISEHQLIELIKKEIQRLGFPEIYKAATNYIYYKALNNYFKSLIFLVHQIVYLSKSSISVIPKQIFDIIRNDSNLPQSLSYDVIKQIIYDLIETFPRHLDIKQIESNKIINYLKNHTRATKQEIAKLYGKGLRATYNKLIELEKKGLIKRNRKKIGDPTYWSLTP